MEEVTRQIGPLAATVGRMDKTLRSLYRNGSDPGGPPGYLETARAEDDERYNRLLKSMEELKEDQRAANKFIVIAGALEERKNALRAKLLKAGWKVATVIFGALVGLGTWGYHELAPVAKVLWEDYLKYHPNVSQKLKSVGSVDGQVYADKKNSTEDAGSNMPVHF